MYCDFQLGVEFRHHHSLSFLSQEALIHVSIQIYSNRRQNIHSVSRVKVSLKLQYVSFKLFSGNYCSH